MNGGCGLEVSAEDESLVSRHKASSSKFKIHELNRVVAIVAILIRQIKPFRREPIQRRTAI